MILDLTNGRELTVEQALRDWGNPQETHSEGELEHADRLIQTLVQERADLAERVETLTKLLAAQHCRDRVT